MPLHFTPVVSMTTAAASLAMYMSTMPVSLSPSLPTSTLWRPVKKPVRWESMVSFCWFCILERLSHSGESHSATPLPARLATAVWR